MDTADYWLNNRLIRVVMEQLKLPLLQIARQAELSSENVSESGYITDMADIAIKTIDSCLLSLSEGNQASLILEPVSVSATINSAAESLGSLAKIYNCCLLYTSRCV